MLRNYSRIMWRVLVRNRLFSFLNLIGLALGISSSLLILLWVLDEQNIDSFHSDRLYRVLENQHFTDGTISTDNSTPGPLAPELKEKYPEVQYAARFFSLAPMLIEYNGKSTQETSRYVDADFIKMFNFPMLHGETFRDPYDILITASSASKIFGDEDALGKTVKVDGDREYIVRGILMDVPANSSLRFDCLIQIDPYYQKNIGWMGQWGNHNTRTYLTLLENADVDAFETKFRGEHKAHQRSSGIDFIIQPFRDGYLHSVFKEGKLTGEGRIENVRTFTIVSIFVLLIACINFMNLSTAQSIKRSREVGIRKVVGAFRPQLVRQFLAESMFFTLVASALGLLIVWLVLPLFNFITEKNIAFSLLNADMILLVVAMVVLTGLIAGSYPALYMSGFGPVAVLKGVLKGGKGAFAFRRILVVVQFALSIGMIVSTVVIARQMIFIQARDIGFNRNGLIYMNLQGQSQVKWETIKQKVATYPSVDRVSVSSASPFRIQNFSWGLEWEGKQSDQEIKFMTLFVDPDYSQTIGFNLLAGRHFYENMAADSFNIMVNESAAAAMGYNDPIGKQVTWWGSRTGRIIGVVKDFNFESVHELVQPVLFFPGKNDNNVNQMNCLIIRVRGNEYAGAINALHEIQKEFLPNYPFEYKIAGDDWNDLHKGESKMTNLLIYFAVLSVIISCLGIFGLAAFSSEQRRKEIGVRKVMGASVAQLTLLLTREFTKLVLFGAVPGCFIACYYLYGWLQHFAYHIDIGFWSVGLAVGIAFLIASVTIGYQSVRASLESPLTNLRYE